MPISWTIPFYPMWGNYDRIRPENLVSKFNYAKTGAKNVVAEFYYVRTDLVGYYSD